MADGLYDRGRQAFLAGDADWDTDAFRAVLIDTGVYTVTGASAGDYTLTPSKSDDVTGISAYAASLALQPGRQFQGTA